MKNVDKRRTKKSTKAELELRIVQVVKLMLNGWSKENILHYSSENWNVGERQTSEYVQLARERIVKLVQKEILFDYAKAVMRYEDLYKLSRESEDIRASISVNKELTALQGLSNGSEVTKFFLEENRREKSRYEKMTMEEIEDEMLYDEDAVKEAIKRHKESVERAKKRLNIKW